MLKGLTFSVEGRDEISFGGKDRFREVVVLVGFIEIGAAFFRKFY